MAQALPKTKPVPKRPVKLWRQKKRLVPWMQKVLQRLSEKLAKRRKEECWQRLKEFRRKPKEDEFWRSFEEFQQKPTSLHKTIGPVLRDPVPKGRVKVWFQTNGLMHGNEFIGDDLVTVVNLVNFSKKAVRRSIERGDPAEDLVTVQNIRAIAGILMKRAKASIVRDDYILRNDELRLARECFDSSSSSSNRGPANEAGAGAKRNKQKDNERDRRKSK